MERRLALLMILMPVLGSTVALVWLWGYGIDAVDIGLCLGMYTVTMLGITAGFHRCFTHRSFQAGNTMRLLLGVAGSMAAQGPVLFWAACHRRHHQYSDQPGDPHSPTLYDYGLRGWCHGLWHAHVGWMLRHNREDWARYVPDLLRDRLVFRLNQYYFIWLGVGLCLPAVLGGVLQWSWQGLLSGLLWGGFVRIFLLHHATWSVNSLCHMYGARPYATDDASTNNLLCALLTCGEGWHNNHHAFPTSARHGLAWWQLDVTYLVLWAAHKAGLVWDIKVAPIPTGAARRRRYRVVPRQERNHHR